MMYKKEELGDFHLCKIKLDSKVTKALRAVSEEESVAVRVINTPNHWL